RAQCVNNLKQIGIALGNYEDAFHSFPAGYLSGGDTGPGMTGTGWGTLILQHLGQGPLFQAYNQAMPVGHPSNWTVRTAPVYSYLCTSDPMAGPFDIQDKDGSKVLARAHSGGYAGNFGKDGDLELADDDGNGIFMRDRFIRISEITDGTTMTVAAG